MHIKRGGHTSAGCNMQSSFDILSDENSKVGPNLLVGVGEMEAFHENVRLAEEETEAHIRQIYEKLKVAAIKNIRELYGQTLEQYIGDLKQTGESEKFVDMVQKQGHEYIGKLMYRVTWNMDEDRHWHDKAKKISNSSGDPEKAEEVLDKKDSAMGPIITRMMNDEANLVGQHFVDMYKLIIDQASKGYYDSRPIHQMTLRTKMNKLKKRCTGKKGYTKKKGYTEKNTYHSDSLSARNRWRNLLLDNYQQQIDGTHRTQNRRQQKLTEKRRNLVMDGLFSIFHKTVPDTVLRSHNKVHPNTFQRLVYGNQCEEDMLTDISKIDEYMDSLTEQFKSSKSVKNRNELLEKAQRAIALHWDFMDNPQRKRMADKKYHWVISNFDE